MNDDKKTRPPAELAALLSPVTVETFLSEYWGRRPLYIPGDEAKLKRLFAGGYDRASFLRDVARTPPGMLHLYSTSPRVVAGEEHETREDLSPEDIDAVLAGGSSVGCRDLANPAIAAFAAALKGQLQVPGDVQVFAFLGDPGIGSPLHLDAKQVFSVQCQGRKRFTTSTAPAIDRPRGVTMFTPEASIHSFKYPAQEWESAQAVRQSPLVVDDLAPGDVVYVPAGVLHATQGLDAGGVSLSLIMQPAAPLRLLLAALERRLLRHADWRQIPATDPRRARPGELPPDARAFFAERIAELRAVLAELPLDGPELDQEWHRAVAEVGKATTDTLALAASPPRDRPVDPGDALRLSRRAPITYAAGAGSEPWIRVYFMESEIELEGPWATFMQKLVTADPFAARTAIEWAPPGEDASWESVRGYLEPLLDQGLLERVDA